MLIKKHYQSSVPVRQSFDPAKGRTHQSFKDECDINVLLNHWLKTGVMPTFNTRQPFYGDVSDLPGFQDALSLTVLAEQQFALLSEEDQDSFHNDPLEYLEAVYQSQEDVGTLDSLDVNVPTDTNLDDNGQKGGKNEKNKESLQDEPSDV